MNTFAQSFGAIIMAGGRGTRMGELTRNVPKPLLKIHNRPILDYVLGSIEQLGIQRKNILVVAKYLAEQIHSHLLNAGVKVSSGRQNSIALNLIEALPHLPENFIAASCDLYSPDLLKEAAKAHKRSGASATLIICKLAGEARNRKLWHYTIGDGVLENLDRGSEPSDWERDVLILKKIDVAQVSDRIKQILIADSTAEAKYRDFSNAWNLVLKLFIENGMTVRILQREFCRSYRINTPEDLNKAQSVVETMGLKTFNSHA